MRKCADWCGRGCTEEEYDQAVRAADRLVAQLGEGWKADVWENLGWHARAVSASGTVRVHISRGGGYYAFFGEVKVPGGRWWADGDTPKAAVSAVVAKVEAERDKLTAWLDGLHVEEGE